MDNLAWAMNDMWKLAQDLYQKGNDHLDICTMLADHYSLWGIPEEDSFPIWLSFFVSGAMRDADE